MKPLLLLCLLLWAFSATTAQTVVTIPAIYPADSTVEIDVAPYLPEQITYQVSFSNPVRGTVSWLPSLKVRYVANSLAAAAYGDGFTCHFYNGFNSFDVTVVIDAASFSSAPPLISNHNTFTYCTDQLGVSSIQFTTSDVGNNYWEFENQIITQPAHGAATILPPTEAGNREIFVYTPSPGFVGTDTIHYRVCKANSPIALCSDGMLFVQSEDCIDDVIVASDYDQILSDSPDSIVINILSHCFADSLPVTVQLLENGYWGNAVVNADQTITYFPYTDGNELIDFIPYQICDPANNCDTAYIYFQSTAYYSDPYYAAPEFLDVAPNQPINIDLFANDSGYHEGVVVDSIIDQPYYGTLTLEANGTYTYVTNPNMDIPSGTTDYVEYIARTPGGYMPHSGINISIYSSNAYPDYYTVPYQTATTLQVLENDLGIDLNITAIASQALWGSVTITNDQQAIIYTPNEGFYGNDIFRYTVCDAGNNCETASVSIQIAAPDTISSPIMPQAVEFYPICIEDSCSGYSVLGNYPYIAPLQYDVTITQPSIYGTSIIDSLGKFCYYINPNMLTADFPLYDTLKVQVCHPNFPDAACGNLVAVLQVDDCYPTILNPEPYYINLSYMAPLDVAFQLSATADYWETLTYTLLESSVLGTISLNPDGSGHFLSNTNLLPGSVDTVTYQCCNSMGFCVENKIYIRTNPSYSCCTLAIDDYYILTADTANTLPVLENDNFGMHIIGIIEPPQYGSISYTDSTVVYTPDSNAYHHDGGFGYIAQHTSGLIDTAYVSLYVEVYPFDPDINYIPSGQNQFFYPCNETNLTFTVIASDPNPNTTLALSITQYPQHGTATQLGNSAITYSPISNYVGVDTIRYTVCETNTPEHYCRDMYAVLNIRDCYDPIEAMPDLAYMPLIDNESTTINVLENDYRETNFITVSVISSPVLGTAILNPDNTITYILDNYLVDSVNINNADYFTYTACTQAGFCDTASVAVMLNANEYTSTATDSRSTLQDVPVTVDVLANDEPNAHIVEITSPPQHGTAFINEDNTITYTPYEGYTGTDYFHYYAVSPYKSLTDTYVSINVIPPQYNNIPDIVANDDYIEQSGSSIWFNVLANDTVDPYNVYSNISLYLIGFPENGQAYLYDDGTLYYYYSSEVGFATAQYVVCSYVGDLLITEPVIMCDTATVYISSPFSNNTMYPGDVNNDQTVNTLDFLAFGMAPLTTGSPRPDASDIWTGQAATTWDEYIDYRPFGEALLINQSLADCNGDGTISFSDASLIQQHYGKSHFPTNNPFWVPVPMFPQEDAPLIRLDLPVAVDTVGRYFADIYLATEEQAAQDMYGIGFSLQFPAEQIPLDSVQFYIADSWLGNANDLEAMMHLDDGEAHIALSRHDGQGRAGYGKIGTLSYYVNSTDL
ncbi:MAG: tandem-95 repeat protein, partial [Chitinophagales bacterium]|nr:tandem-95 repeat protein [Chitinophagales bacterium]